MPNGNLKYILLIYFYQNEVYICDSLGGIMPDKKFPTALINFLHLMLFSRVLIITKQLQPLDSEKCGQYAVVFIKEMSKNNSFQNFMKLFTHDFKQNDNIISFLCNQ